MFFVHDQASFRNLWRIISEVLKFLAFNYIFYFVLFHFIIIDKFIIKAILLQSIEISNIANKVN